MPAKAKIAVRFYTDDGGHPSVIAEYTNDRNKVVNKYSALELFMFWFILREATRNVPTPSEVKFFLRERIRSRSNASNQEFRYPEAAASSFARWHDMVSEADVYIDDVKCLGKLEDVIAEFAPRIVWRFDTVNQMFIFLPPSPPVPAKPDVKATQGGILHAFGRWFNSLFK